MKNKIVYSYDIETSEYLGAITAYESPLEPNVYLMPSQSTEKEPPQTGEHEIAVWSDDSWLIVDDWRGAKGFVNEERIEIKELGPKPENWSETPPLPTLEEAKTAKYAEIANARWQ